MGQKLDLVYHFYFDDATNPKRIQIHPDAVNLDVNLSAEWLLDFEGELETSNPDFPGSVCWSRPSYALGKKINEYTLVQVIDEHGKYIEPAWGAFAAYQRSEEAGSTP